MEDRVPNVGKTTAAQKRKPYEDHGVRFDGARDHEAFADSPFDPSGSSDKFHLNLKTGEWHDKKLGRGGKLTEFLAAMQKHVYGPALTASVLKKLSTHRRLPVCAFSAWTETLGFDTERNAYTFLCHDPVSRRPSNIYWWTTQGKQWSTTGGVAGLFGGQRLSGASRSSPIYLCEGPHDAIAIAVLLTRADKPGLAVAVPGASIFKKEWTEAFRARDVRICYDNDDAGRSGDATVGKRLRGVARSLQFVHWPDDKPDGWDVRDEVCAALDAKKPKACWKRLASWLQEQPRVEVEDTDDDSAASSVSLASLMKDWVSVQLRVPELSWRREFAPGGRLDNWRECGLAQVKG